MELSAPDWTRVWLYVNFKLMPKLVFSQSGFSLAEILVVLAIVSLIGAISIPNLSKFSRSQKIPDTTRDIVSVLRQAQTNAFSGARCNSNVSADWRVSINNLTKTYSLFARCQDQSAAVGTSGNTGPLTFDPPKLSRSFPATISVLAVTCSWPTTIVNIIFSVNRQVFYSCGDPATAVLNPAPNVYPGNIGVLFSETGSSGYGIVSVDWKAQVTGLYWYNGSILYNY